MILYFSGVGNTRLVARQLAALCNDRCQAIEASTPPLTAFCREDETLVLCFPVYAWGPPLLVEEYLKRSQTEVIQTKPKRLYMVCTCGDDIGMTDVFVNKLLKPYGRCADAVFSVQMRNTYVSLPGFDVDDDALVRRKLQHAATRLPSIIEAIRQRLHQAYDVYPGAYPWFKSCILRPLFNRFLVTDRFFRTTEACTRCGACAAACPVDNIHLQSDGPRWKGSCTGCLACYHRCPTRAVRFGRTTEHKGQYLYSRTE